MVGTEERKLLRRLVQRDPAALAALIDRYGSYVAAVVWAILKGVMSPEDAEEVVSDVFLAAWDQSGDLQPGKAKAWLGAVARNKARNKLRELSPALPLEDDVLELPQPDSFTLLLEQEESDKLVREAVDSLPGQDREIFLRHYFLFQSVGRIAADLGLKEATVRTRLYRGREKLKTFLTREGFVYEA